MTPYVVSALIDAIFFFLGPASLTLAVALPLWDVAVEGLVCSGLAEGALSFSEGLRIACCSLAMRLAAGDKSSLAPRFLVSMPFLRGGLMVSAVGGVSVAGVGGADALSFSFGNPVPVVLAVLGAGEAAVADCGVLLAGWDAGPTALVLSLSSGILVEEVLAVRYVI